MNDQGALTMQVLNVIYMSFTTFTSIHVPYHFQPRTGWAPDAIKADVYHRSAR